MPRSFLLPTHLQRRAARDMALQVTGAATLYSRLTRPRIATILCYHSVAEDGRAGCVDPRWRLSPQEFDAQCAFLAESRRVVSLSELVNQLHGGGEPEPGTVAIAFDDGYLDNLTQAAPILARHKLPATLFLATGHVDRAEPQFVDRLYTYWNTRTRHRLRMAGLDVNLSDPVQRASGYRELNRRLIVADRDQREDLLCCLAQQLGTPVELPARLTLDWDEVRRLVREFPLFEIGVHSVNHLDLVTHTHRAIEELTRSRAAVHTELGVSAVHHSFPFGRSTPFLRAKVKQLGFESACADRDTTLVARGSDPYWLGRVYPTSSLPLLQFRTSGMGPDIRRLFS